MIEKLTPTAYAKRVGITQQAASWHIKRGNWRNLKGVVELDEIESNNGRKVYVLHFNPDYENEST